MPDITTHPGACPHCGGTIVNIAEPMIAVRPAILSVDADGTPSCTIGDPDGYGDPPAQSAFHCHGCGSEYPVPDGLVEHFDHRMTLMNTPYPSPVQRGHDSYIGASVRWVVEPIEENP